MIGICIPFYQTQWSGIDLRQICADINEPCNQLPSARFYNRYYEILNERDIQFSAQWLASKNNQSTLLRSDILRHSTPKARILSIGAGTGIVEKPLIEEGFAVELQDFQTTSFSHFGLDRLVPCHGGPIKNIAERYDVCYSSAVSYALNRSQLKELLEDVYKLLKPGGIFIWMDAALSWHEIYSYARNHRQLSKHSVLWGYKRSLQYWEKASGGFSTIEKSYHSADMTPLYPACFLSIPFATSVFWQTIILKKSPH